MHNNHLYNLMAQLVEEQRSLYRIQKMYKQDAQAEGLKEDLWVKLEAQKTDNVKILTEAVAELLSKNLYN